jgi:uncharacterized protein
MRDKIIRLFAVILMASWTFCAEAIPSRPEPQRLVNDYAGLFSPYQAEELERMLVAFDDSTSNQIAVVTVLDLEGRNAAEYATQIGLEWQVGSERFDNGIVILVKPKTDDSSGQVFIAVGYGLEGAIPDAYAKRIINNEMIPHFMSNDYYGGVEAACRTLMALASGEISQMREYAEDDTEELIMAIIVMIFIIAFVLIVINSNDNGKGNGGRRRVIYTGPIITSGNDYGGFGRGGFGGGFGGFGGGSFGGGGAGGSW